MRIDLPPSQHMQQADPQPLCATDITLIATQLQQTLQRRIMNMLIALQLRRAFPDSGALPNPNE